MVTRYCIPLAALLAYTASYAGDSSKNTRAERLLSLINKLGQPTDKGQSLRGSFELLVRARQPIIGQGIPSESENDQDISMQLHFYDPQPTPNMVTTLVAEEPSTPTSNPLTTVISGGVTKPRKPRNRNEQSRLRELPILRKAQKRQVAGCAATAEVYGLCTQLNDIVETAARNNNRVTDLQALQWYETTQHISSGFSAEQTALINKDRAAIKRRMEKLTRIKQ